MSLIFFHMGVLSLYHLRHQPLDLKHRNSISEVVSTVLIKNWLGYDSIEATTLKS